MLDGGMCDKLYLKYQYLKKSLYILKMYLKYQK